MSNSLAGIVGKNVTVELNDGSKREGKFASADSSWVCLDGAAFPANSVKKIEFSPSGASEHGSVPWYDLPCHNFGDAIEASEARRAAEFDESWRPWY